MRTRKVLGPLVAGTLLMTMAAATPVFADHELDSDNGVALMELLPEVAGVSEGIGILPVSFGGMFDDDTDTQNASRIDRPTMDEP